MTRESDQPTRGTLFLLNGPNLNLLGEREPTLYGAVTLSALEASLQQEAAQLGWALESHQSNHEGVLVDLLHEARERARGVIFNPAAYGHYSVALRDAIVASTLPVVEVHISNIAAREEFRHRTVTAPVSVGTVSGFGVYGYRLALYALHQKLTEESL